MARPTSRNDKLAAALKRKDPEAVLKQLGELLESARQSSLATGAIAARKEREALLSAAEERPEFKARAVRASAAAAGDMAFAKTVEDTKPLIARPDPKGLTIAGTAVAGRTGNAAVTIVFTDDEGREIDGTPEIAVAKNGAVSQVLSERELAKLREAIGAKERARIAMKVGRRVVATTSRALFIRPGGVLQFSLRGA